MAAVAAMPDSHCCLIDCLYQAGRCKYAHSLQIRYWLATHCPLKLRLCRGAAFCSAHNNMDHYCSQVLRHLRCTFLQCQTSYVLFTPCCIRPPSLQNVMYSIWVMLTFGLPCWPGASMLMFHMFQTLFTCKWRRQSECYLLITCCVTCYLI